MSICNDCEKKCCDGCCWDKQCNCRCGLSLFFLGLVVCLCAWGFWAVGWLFGWNGCYNDSVWTENGWYTNLYCKYQAGVKQESGWYHAFNIFWFELAAIITILGLVYEILTKCELIPGSKAIFVPATYKQGTKTTDMNADKYWGKINEDQNKADFAKAREPLALTVKISGGKVSISHPTYGEVGSLKKEGKFETLAEQIRQLAPKKPEHEDALNSWRGADGKDKPPSFMPFPVPKTNPKMLFFQGAAAVANGDDLKDGDFTLKTDGIVGKEKKAAAEAADAKLNSLIKSVGGKVVNARETLLNVESDDQAPIQYVMLPAEP